MVKWKIEGIIFNGTIFIDIVGNLKHIDIAVFNQAFNVG